MYQKAYGEVVADDFRSERANEAMAIDHAIGLMREAEAEGMDSVAAVKARHFVHRLWMYFLDDLSAPENGLPDELKAHLISIGIWVLRELEDIEKGGKETFADIMEVMGILRDGLK